ncbi:hypothetical protein ACFL2T_05555 [Elusimicrobiota bacterium]
MSGFVWIRVWNGIKMGLMAIGLTFCLGLGILGTVQYFTGDERMGQALVSFVFSASIGAIGAPILGIPLYTRVRGLWNTEQRLEYGIMAGTVVLVICASLATR